jgi:hypothetical protein
MPYDILSYLKVQGANMSSETYTLKQAMERLGLQSANAFFQLERKYPEAFVVIKRASSKDARSRTGVEYDKAALERFAQRREQFKQEKP